MDTVLNRLFAYNAWANREVATSFHSVVPIPPKALKLLGHVLAAESLWYERIHGQKIHGQKQSFAVWPDLSLAECEALGGRMNKLWRDYLLQEGRGEALAQTISYRNSKGEDWNSRAEDILLHVIAHSAYHRGQVAAEMRAAGHAPAYTDFIHAVRNGLID